MKVYLTKQQEGSLQALTQQVSFAQAAVKLYLQGVLDAAGVAPQGKAQGGRDEQGFFLEWTEPESDGPAE